MKKLIIIAIIAIAMAGCGAQGVTLIPTGVGDNNVDEVERAEINLAVSAVLRNNPDLISPAYTVSSALLERIDGRQDESLSFIETAYNEQLDVLDLNPQDRADFLSLVSLVRAAIRRQLRATENEFSDLKYSVVIRDVIEVVHNAAQARL